MVSVTHPPTLPLQSFWHHRPFQSLLLLSFTAWFPPFSRAGDFILLVRPLPLCLPPPSYIVPSTATCVNSLFGAVFVATFFSVPRRSAAAYNGEISCAARLTLPSLHRSSGHSLFVGFVGGTSGDVGPLGLTSLDPLRVGFLTWDGLVEVFSPVSFTLSPFTVCGNRRWPSSLMEQWSDGHLDQAFHVVRKGYVKVDPVLMVRWKET